MLTTRPYCNAGRQGPRTPRPMAQRLARQLIILLIPVAALYLAIQAAQSRPAVLSRWSLTGQIGQALAPKTTQSGLVGRADPLAAAMRPAVPSHEHLAAFNSASAVQEEAGDGRVAYYRRAMPGGELAYIVVKLDERTHVQVINADGATPGSDETGDTIWTDRQQHLATVAEMAAAPYAARDGAELLGAMAFGFHGAVRTSNEGSVVINGVVHRVNPGRGALCITPGLRAIIDRLDAQALAGCQQAIGGGPVILWQGKIANPAVSAEDGEQIPFNPLGEDFTQLDWRVKIYTGTYPKTAVCVGDLPGGRSFLVLANSVGIVGTELARALRDMGCTTALGGDDDTSTQAVWRGHPLWSNQPRAVPDAIGVYLRP
jgi:Phosphodiester glycosidase